MSEFFLIFIKIFGGVIALGIGAELIVRSAVNLSKIYNISLAAADSIILDIGTQSSELFDLR